MGLHLQLVVAPWCDQAPQPGGASLDVPILRAWIVTLGAAEALRWIEGGDAFSGWLGRIIGSGGGEHLITLDPLDVGDLHAAWTADLSPKLGQLLASARAHDFHSSYGVRDAAELEAVLRAWADCVAHALGSGRGLIGTKT